MKGTRIVMLAVAAAALGCSTMVVDNRVERGTDLAKYRTFTLDQIEAVSDPISVDLFATDVGNAVESRGFVRVPKDGDLLVSAHFSIEAPPPDPMGSYGPPRLEAPKATVAVELVDPRSNSTVWTATAHEEVPKAATRGERQQTADQLARKIFEKIPLRPK